MKHISEATLELFVLKPDALSAETAEQTQAHLQACTLCRERLEYLQSFYEELRKLSETISPRVDAFAKSLSYPEDVIVLRPLHHRPRFADNEYITVLAAQTADAPTQRHKPLAILVSEEENLVLRVVHDSEANTYRLYILADDPRKFSGVIVSIPDLYLDLVTDESGRAEFNLTKDLIPKNWNSLQMFIKPRQT